MNNIDFWFIVLACFLGSSLSNCFKLCKNCYTKNDNNELIDVEIKE